MGPTTGARWISSRIDAAALRERFGLPEAPLMGVRRFRSVADLPGPQPLEPLDPENLRLAFDLMEAARRLAESKDRRRS
jgi:hypothetical protein